MTKEMLLLMGSIMQFVGLLGAWLLYWMHGLEIKDLQRDAVMKGYADWKYKEGKLTFVWKYIP